MPNTPMGVEHQRRRALLALMCLALALWSCVACGPRLAPGTRYLRGVKCVQTGAWVRERDTTWLYDCEPGDTTRRTLRPIVPQDGATTPPPKRVA